MNRLFEILCISFLGLICAASTAVAQSGYPLGAGDRISISFIANSDYDRMMTVDFDGNISVPLLGEMNVQGQTIQGLREQIPLLLTGSVYRERVNSEYLLVTIEPDEVFVDIEQYRPVFVDGAVIAPGRQLFEVGMSVRQAIAGAEGLIDDRPLGLNGNEIRNHPSVLMADLIGVVAEIAVHNAILAGSDTIDFSDIEILNAPAELRQEAIVLAQRQIETSTEIIAEELSFLDTSVEESETRVIAALRLEEAMTEIAATEEQEVDRVESLVARRIVASEQLTQVRRLYLQSVDRLGVVQADRLNAEADRRALVLERNQVVRERALATQARLQELSQQAAQLRVRIELSSTGPVTLNIDGNSLAGPQITIFRQLGGQAREIDASPETPVFPGDVVHVSFPT
ncbi:MAG: polysaccharide biosynthesis/export family protein [Yoonia sp.]|uniref:polysaccharide biosynthesis/export family protein n=1 Tax=Yoonia sp. TaxID=2212373 RepID=UPI003EF9CA59